MAATTGLDPAGPVAVLALREPGTGKTRFAGLDRAQRAALAVAMACDTVRALRREIDRVIMVCGPLDAVSRQQLVAVGATVVDEPPDPRGLNAALTLGLTRVPAEATALACVADLPALTGEAVRTVLAAARRGPVVVPDTDAIGSTMIAGPASTLVPSFGGSSARRHHALGLRLLAFAPPEARRDADDPDALAAAVRLGTGPATTRLLRSAAWWKHQVPTGEPVGTCRASAGRRARQA